VKSDGDDVAHAHYVRLCRARDDGSVSEVVLTRAALHLHTFGVLTGIERATPGFVSDRYLSSIRIETTLTALELTLAGLWERTEGGYLVSERDAAAVAEQVHLQLAVLAERCTADGGHHVGAGSGTRCPRCGESGTVQQPVRTRRRKAA